MVPEVYVTTMDTVLSHSYGALAGTLNHLNSIKPKIHYGRMSHIYLVQYW